MIIIKILIGAALLIFGRKFFWLLIGGVGFIAGSYLATQLFQGAAEWVSIVFALVIGIIGVILAMFLQKIGIGLAGFIIGGMLFSGIISTLLGSFNLPSWVFFLIGGVLGALLTFVIFEWSLILFSSIAGAWMVTDALTISTLVSGILFFVLLLGGIVIQFRMKKDNH